MHASDAVVMARQHQLQQRHFGQSCPFLDSQGSCSIYRERPIACRLHMNLDEDDLLCRPGKAVEVNVPSLDVTVEKAHYLLALGLNSRLADIRDWFPQACVQDR